MSDLAARAGDDPASLGPSTWGFESDHLLRILATRPGRNRSNQLVSSWATKRDSLDGEEFLRLLQPFWRDAINLDPNRPPASELDDRFGLNRMRVTPFVGEAAKFMNMLNFDHVLILLEERRAARQRAWRITTGALGLKVRKYDLSEHSLFSVSVDE